MKHKLYIARKHSFLVNEMSIVRFLCFFDFVMAVASVFLSPHLIIPEIFMIFVFAVLHHVVLKYKFENLRYIKFKSIKNPDVKILVKKLSPIFNEKYNIHIVRRKLKITALYDGLVLDIIFDDNFFTIKYLPLSVKDVSSLKKYAQYKKIVKAMRIIAYEIQKEIL